MKNYNFEQFVTAQKYQNTILEGLTDHGYNGLDNRTKVTRLMDGVKVDSLNNVKAMIIPNSDFCKDFDKCVTLYKALLNQSSITLRETRRVLEVSSSRHGGSGSEKFKDRYYTKY